MSSDEAAQLSTTKQGQGPLASLTSLATLAQHGAHKVASWIGSTGPLPPYRAEMNDTS